MKEKFFMLFDDNKQFYFLWGDSHSEKIVNSLSRILKSDKIDFLFIDGDNSYEVVKQDFYVYKKYVSGGGIIALHYIDNTNSAIGVKKFWNEIKYKYPSEEIVASQNQVWAGIGIIYL